MATLCSVQSSDAFADTPSQAFEADAALAEFMVMTLHITHSTERQVGRVRAVLHTGDDFSCDIATHVLRCGLLPIHDAEFNQGTAELRAGTLLKI